MQQCCGNCAFLNTHDKKECGNYFSGYHDEYYCKDKHKYVKMEEGRNCRYFRENPHNQSSGGCFITTIVVSMCGFNDDSKALKVLRSFRNRVLQNTEEGISLLKIYDVIGPQIADKLYEERDNKLLGYKLYSEDLLPAIGALEKEDYYQAMYLYKNMVERLAYKYNISMDLISYEYDCSVKNTEMGHGTARVNKISVNK